MRKGLLAYNLGLSLLGIAGVPFLPFLAALGERHRAGWRERLGWYPAEVRAAVPPGVRPIWIHAVSVGEVLSSRGLVRGLRERFPAHPVLLSTFTLAGYRMARRSIPEACAVIFLPIDYPRPVRSALRSFHPALLVFLETEIWPNLLWNASRLGVPSLLLSGRISEKALRRYLLFRVVFGEAVRSFRAMGMQTERDAARAVRLGADPSRVVVTGNLKRAGAKPPPVTREELGLATDPGPLWVAGSTRQGEEEILLDAFLRVRREHGSVRLVLAPRHPHRFAEVERLLQQRGLRFSKRSDGILQAGREILLLDTLGELPAFYAVADVAFVGGSLVEAGGHNPVEPASCAKPVLFGPHMENCGDVAEALKRGGGALEVRNPEELARAVSALLGDPQRAREMGRKAAEACAEDHGVLERSLDLVGSFLGPGRV
jgi:3-deoxy-D-manno-octulosonic-acid transferase